MEQIYAIRPAPVEVFDLGEKTDIILRRDIQEITKTMEPAEVGGAAEEYTAYSCNEAQIRKYWRLSVAEVTEDAQRLWEEAVSGETIGPTIEPSGSETGITERMQTMETRIDAQERAINDLLISVIPELLGGE